MSAKRRGGGGDSQRERGGQACCGHEGSDGEREYWSQQPRARDCHPPLLRKDDGQRGGDSEEELTACSIW